MRRILQLLAVALVAGLVGFWLGDAWRLPPEQPVPAGVAVAAPGDPLPELRLPDLDGRMQPLRVAAGRPLLINVWASWCAPCVKEMPLLDAFFAEQGQNGIDLLGIALDTPEAVRAFLDRHSVRYRILLDTPGPADSSVWLGNTRAVLPYSVLIDTEGRVVRQHLGELSERKLRAFARLD